MIFSHFPNEDVCVQNLKNIFLVSSSFNSHLLKATLMTNLKFHLKYPVKVYIINKLFANWGYEIQHVKLFGRCENVESLVFIAFK